MTNKILFYIGFCLINLLFACKPKAGVTHTTMVFANETDFICGMKVQLDYTDAFHYDGNVYAFCSASRYFLIGRNQGFAQKVKDYL